VVIRDGGLKGRKNTKKKKKRMEMGEELLKCESNKRMRRKLIN
jgi:hypothetical protein